MDLLDRDVADLLVKDALTTLPGQREDSEYGFLVNASKTRNSVDPDAFHEQAENLDGLLFGNPHVTDRSFGLERLTAG